MSPRPVQCAHVKAGGVRELHPVRAKGPFARQQQEGQGRDEDWTKRAIDPSWESVWYILNDALEKWDTAPYKGKPHPDGAAAPSASRGVRGHTPLLVHKTTPHRHDSRDVAQEPSAEKKAGKALRLPS